MKDSLLQSHSEFDTQYKKLNKAQKEAVDTIDGPVMVVAGPGTGKTQILALRIGNILQKTDTQADSILCLTFTRSGVSAMKKRLERYLGPAAHKVAVSTFHGFAMNLVEKHYILLGFEDTPKLLNDDEAILLVDEILHNNDWQYIRPRTNPVMYFHDLKQLISVLKRERLTPQKFLEYVEADIQHLQSDPESISARGESKGKLKKEVEKKIESLLRTKEVVEFYRIYEEKKKSQSLMDYDDVLECAVQLVESFEDVRADVYEEYLYVLVDEHQDSSGVQNNFLKAVWKGEERPNIFVVGDDRQLIYGFSGASFSYFEEFAHIFGKAKLITLIENYRSTSGILLLADDLLKSSITTEKLQSNKKDTHLTQLSEFAYPRDEIIGAGLYFKDKIENGVPPEQCALLVPKNHHVRSAMQILRTMGIKVSSGKSMSLFESPQAESFLRVLGIIVDPLDSTLLAQSLLDTSAQIDTLEAHKFLKSIKPNNLSIDDLIACGSDQGLFKGENSISKWGNKLKGWLELSKVSPTIATSTLGQELLIDQSATPEALLTNVEVVRSFLHAALLFEQKNNPAKFVNFLEYFKRLKSYNSHISMATFGATSGVEVMTLHKSKGLEYEAVWIAHMNEETLMSEKRGGFTLPEKVKDLLSERDVETAKRELYVAITRAKEFCTISYAAENYNGLPLELAHIIGELPQDHFDKKTKEQTEKEILSHGPQVYTKTEEIADSNAREELEKFAREHYAEIKVSVTMLNNFFECPWKWYFRNFLKLPELKSPSLALGSAVHSTIEFILKNKSLPSKEDIRKEIEVELKKELVGSVSEIKKMAKDAEAAVQHFIDRYYKNLSKDHVSERSLQFRDPQFPHLLMYGKIDLTERFGSDEITVTDFKTGSSKTRMLIEKLDEENRLSSYMRQLAMYSYLISGTEKNKHVGASRLLFLESLQDDKNALYSTHITGEQIDLLLKDIKDYDTLLTTGEWMNRPCNYKSFGRGTECEYCKIAEMFTKEKLKERGSVV